METAYGQNRKYFHNVRFSPEEEKTWLDFVVASRNGMKPWVQYDVVEGGVANDRVIDTVELYTIGILDKSSALGRLSEHQPNHQICILNQAILDKYLKFVKVIEL